MEGRQQLLMMTSRQLHLKPLFRVSWNNILFEVKSKPTFEVRRSQFAFKTVATKSTSHPMEVGKKGKGDGKSVKKEGQHQNQNLNPNKDVCWHFGKNGHLSKGGRGKPKNVRGKGAGSLEQRTSCTASPRDRARHVDIPVPHGRVGKRGLQGFPRGQSSTASAVEQTIGVDRGGFQGFPRGQSSTASAVEQTFSQAPHRSKPRAPVHGRHDEWVCVVDVEDDGEYYWNRRDNSTCWRLPRGVKHRWCLLPSGLYRDIVLQVDYRVLPPL